MGIKKYFIDNAAYGVDDMNAAFSHLITSGVTCFKEGGSVTSDTEEAVAMAVDSGVDLYNANSCKVVKLNGSYVVTAGVCFLPDGSHLAVDSDGYVLDVASGSVQYVYARHDVIKNTLDFEVSDTAGGADAVPIATINADGTVTDTRKFACAKVALPSTNLSLEKNITVEWSSGNILSMEAELGYNGFNYVYWWDDGGDKYYLSPIGSTPTMVYNTPFNHLSDIYLTKSGSKIILTSAWEARKNGTTELTLLFV